MFYLTYFCIIVPFCNIQITNLPKQKREKKKLIIFHTRSKNANMKKEKRILTLGLLTGELAVSSRASSTKAPIVFLFLKLNLLLLILSKDFFPAKEAASETREELLKREEQ